MKHIYLKASYDTSLWKKKKKKLHPINPSGAGRIQACSPSKFKLVNSLTDDMKH